MSQLVCCWNYSANSFSMLPVIAHKLKLHYYFIAAMLFLRRLRKRRAKKDAARQSLVEKISKASGERSKAIFRGRWGNDSTDVCVHDGLFANATNPTQDEDDSSSTLSSPRGALLTLGQKNQVLSKGGNAMVYNYEEILDLQAEIEELKIVHGEVIDNKDETIFNGLVELGFAKDDIQKVMIELDEVSKVLQNLSLIHI